MPDSSINSNLTTSKDKKLAVEVALIRQVCHKKHGKKTLFECPDCYARALETFGSRYIESSDDEWFTSRGGFLDELKKLIAEAKEYQLDLAAIDSRIKEERTRWYIENVRESLRPIIMVDESGVRDAILEKLEEPPSDITELTEQITLLFKQLHPGIDVSGISDRLASAPDKAARLKVLKEEFFTPRGGGGDDGLVPLEMYDKYYNLLEVMHGSMDQVTIRIQEDIQAAMGARAQADKIRARLADLKRAQAAFELEKKKKAKTLANSVKNSVPDKLYEIPPCAAGCGETPRPEKFLCCMVCEILVNCGVQEYRTVYCSSQCGDKVYDDHFESAHTCATGDDCIQLQDEDAIMEEDGSDGMSSITMQSSTMQFCAECLSSLKQPTLWCSAHCAARDFQQHRENVHLPEREKLKLDVAGDEDQLVYDESEKQAGDKAPEGQAAAPSTGAEASAKKNKTYRAKDIKSLLLPIDEAVHDWEKANGLDRKMSEWSKY